MASKSQDPTAPVTPRTGAPRGATDRFGQADRSAATGAAVPDEQSPAEALRGIKAHLTELAEYVGYFLSAKADGIKVALRNAGMYAVIGVIGLIAGSAFVTSTVVLFCVGVAAALTRLFGGRLWAGTLVTAILFMAILAGGILLGMKWLSKSSRERTVRKYASRQQQQRAKFGTDVQSRSADPADPNG